MTKPKLSELLLGGPGHDGYAYNADVWCVDCGQDIIRDIYDDATEFEDTDSFPQPIFFGESDCAQHCAECGEYLYGLQEEEPTEPEEGDWTTEDHKRFYSYGKLILDVSGQELTEDKLWDAIVAQMNRDKFWPNVWFISDHGNAHLMTR